MQNVVVIGAGVIGLSVARALARLGAAVTVLERDSVPHGATWAAGGMLAPLGEARQPGPFLSFALESLDRWPGWVAQLEAETGLEAGYRPCGKLLVAATEGETSALRVRFEWQTDDGHAPHWLEGTALRRVEPALAPEWRSGLHLPLHASVDPRRLHALLLAAAEKAGVEIRRGVSVEGLLRDGEGVVGVVSADGLRWPADHTILAAGAWSGTLSGLPRPLPVRPVRGQMLALSVETPPLRGLVAGPGAYLIPREAADGRPLVVIGASMDEAGFAVDTDDATIDALRRAAEALVPALVAAVEEERWAGLRPATPDDLPILGPDPDTPGLVYATGHHRNGILLAPATAERIAARIMGDPPGRTGRGAAEGSDEAERGGAAFSPTRFG